MPTYEFDLDEFNKLITKVSDRPVTKEEIMKEFPNFGIPVDEIGDDNVVGIEVFANRPDNLSIEGLARAYAGFTERDLGFVEYKIEDTEPIQVYITPEMKKYRPYLAFAKVTGVDLSNEEIVKSVFTFQEKLHITHCRNRRKASIGLYDIDAGKLEAPITLKMAKFDEMTFVPLDEEKEMTIGEMLEKTPKGREYRHLVAESKAPVLIDKNNQILSVVPILNANDSRITEKTRNLFVDCTGTDYYTMISAFNMVLTSLAERGGKIHPAILHYEYETPAGKEVKLPDFTPKKYTIDPEYVNKKLGIKLTPAEQIKALQKMRLGAKLVKKGKTRKNIEILVPCYRTDILHPIDFVEEIAIGYNYNKFPHTIPNVVTMGKESRWQILKRKLAHLYTGIGAYEVMTYMLTSEDKNFTKMELPISYDNVVKIANPLTTLTTIVRNWITPSLLEILQRNKKFPYPQKFFEMAKVTKIVNESVHDTLTMDYWHLAYVESSNEVNYNTIRAALATLEFNLDLRFQVKPVEKPFLISGRSASIHFNDEEIGFLGEIHPQVLLNWELELPVVAFEIDTTQVYYHVKKIIGED